jgi:hypothetical protein
MRAAFFSVFGTAEFFIAFLCYTQPFLVCSTQKSDKRCFVSADMNGRVDFLLDELHKERARKQVQIMAMRLIRRNAPYHMPIDEVREKEKAKEEQRKKNEEQGEGRITESRTFSLGPLPDWGYDCLQHSMSDEEAKRSNLFSPYECFLLQNLGVIE